MASLLDLQDKIGHAQTGQGIEGAVGLVHRDVGVLIAVPDVDIDARIRNGLHVALISPGGVDGSAGVDENGSQQLGLDGGQLIAPACALRVAGSVDSIHVHIAVAFRNGPDDLTELIDIGQLRLIVDAGLIGDGDIQDITGVLCLKCVGGKGGAAGSVAIVGEGIGAAQPAQGSHERVVLSLLNMFRDVQAETEQAQAIAGGAHGVYGGVDLECPSVPVKTGLESGLTGSKGGAVFCVHREGRISLAVQRCGAGGPVPAHLVPESLSQMVEGDIELAVLKGSCGIPCRGTGAIGLRTAAQREGSAVAVSCASLGPAPLRW